MSSRKPNRVQTDQIHSVQQLTVRTGPLPDPITLQEYDRVHPGAAELILKTFEDEVAHRHRIDDAHLEIEKKYADTDSRNSLLGICFGFAIGIISIAGGVYIAVVGSSPSAGTFLSTSGLAGIIGAFVYGTRAKKN